MYLQEWAREREREMYYDAVVVGRRTASSTILGVENNAPTESNL